MGKITIMGKEKWLANILIDKKMVILVPKYLNVIKIWWRERARVIESK